MPAVRRLASARPELISTDAGDGICVAGLFDPCAQRIALPFETGGQPRPCPRMAELNRFPARAAGEVAADAAGWTLLSPTDDV